MTPALLDRPPVRQPLQGGLGVGLAIGAGSLISGQRWYWAVIAAFIVGIGVGSRTEATVKAVQRLAGTLLGIVAGIFIGSAVSGHADIIFALVLICVFVGFYAFQAAYGIMTFCITVMLALLYGLLGQFQPHLLVLRLEETAAGAAIGALVSIAVLPVRQNEALLAGARDYLESLARVFEVPPGETDGRRQAVPELQRKTQALRNSVGGIKRGWIPFVPMAHRRALRAAMRCTFLAREAAARPRLREPQRKCVLAAIEATRRHLDGACETGAELSARRPEEIEEPDERLFLATLDAIARLDRHLGAAFDGRDDGTPWSDAEW